MGERGGILPKEYSSQPLIKGFSESPQKFEVSMPLPLPRALRCLTPHCVCSPRCFCSLLQLLAAIQLFGANLDDYLHLLLPPIVKLFDAPEVPLPSRK